MHGEQIVDGAGAALLLSASLAYRLGGPTRFAPAVWGAAVSLAPALTGHPSTRGIAVSAGAAAICAVASGHASRTRIAQLPIGWGRRLEHEVNEGRGRGER